MKVGQFCFQGPSENYVQGSIKMTLFWQDQVRRISNMSIEGTAKAYSIDIKKGLQKVIENIFI